MSTQKRTMPLSWVVVYDENPPPPGKRADRVINPPTHFRPAVLIGSGSTAHAIPLDLWYVQLDDAHAFIDRILDADPLHEWGVYGKESE